MGNNFFDYYKYDLSGSVITGAYPSIDLTDNTSPVIDIPAGKNYVEILGFKIDGFDSFEEFLKELKSLQNIRDLCEELEQKLKRITKRAEYLEEENKRLYLLTSEGDRTLVNYYKEHYVHKGKIEKLLNDLKEELMSMRWSSNDFFSSNNYRRIAHEIQILEKLLEEE